MSPGSTDSSVPEPVEGVEVSNCSDSEESSASGVNTGSSTSAKSLNKAFISSGTPVSGGPISTGVSPFAARIPGSSPRESRLDFISFKSSRVGIVYPVHINRNISNNYESFFPF